MIDSATLDRWRESILRFAGDVRNKEVKDELLELAEEMLQLYLDVLRRETSVA